MPKALVLSGHDLGAWRQDFARGAAPAALPYGVDALRSADFELTVRSNSSNQAVTRLRAKIEHRTGYGVALPLQAVPAVLRNDVVIALLEREGALPAQLRRWHLPPYSRRPLVIWSCWLADDIRQADAEQRRAMKRRFEGADLITHLSRHETEIFTDLGISKERLFPVTYGVSHEFYAPGAGERDIQILAVGQDRGRDYATLFDAIRDSDLTLDLVCRPDNVAGLDVPDNVRMHGVVSLPTYRSLLQRAQVVAVPTHDLAYPTGSSVALESASSGACVVVTGTRAMRDYFTDGGDGRFVDEGDVDGWRMVLTELSQDRAQRDRLGAAARASVEATFNARHMWTELADVIRERGLV